MRLIPFLFGDAIVYQCPNFKGGLPEPMMTYILSIELLGTNLSEIRIGMLSFSFKKMHLNLYSAKMAAILSRRDGLILASSSELRRRDYNGKTSQITKFMGPTWAPPGSCRPQMGPMLAPWTWLSGISIIRQGISIIDMHWTPLNACNTCQFQRGLPT